MLHIINIKTHSDLDDKRKYKTLQVYNSPHMFVLFKLC